MSAISAFYGIIIYMWSRGEHNPPHIHAEYAEYDAVFDFNGKMLTGKFPKGKKKLVVAWIEIHKEELAANWKLASSNQNTFMIQPL